MTQETSPVPGPARQPILLATGNTGKIREIVQILDGLPVILRQLSEFPNLPEAIESGKTFCENAELKARHYAELTGLVTLAEDSGIEVDALNGAPGVYSARFAGGHGDDAANNTKVIELLRDVPPERRTGRFRCVSVLATAEEVLAVAEGSIEGRILDELRGEGGFGYDPLFYVPELGCTTAQISREQKNRISHRGKALRAMRQKIEEWLNR
jgi:XTP/dITP diphosphohydrolase